MTNNTTAALTDEQIVEIYDDFYTQEDERESSHILPFARAIERALLTSPRAAGLPEGWKLVPIERSYDMRIKALIAFNTTEKETNDRDDALDAAYRAMLDAAPAAPVADPQWLPIEIAPKDGVQILLSNGTEVQQGWWMHDEGGTTEHRDMDGRWIGQDDRDGYIGWWDVSGGMQPCPDRWMPMPPPLDPASAEPVTALVMQPLTDAALREALDEFELVCENNDVRRLTDDEKYAAQEFALSLIHGDPSAAQAVAADGDACKGKNCGSTNGVSHSPECIAEHEAAVTGAVAADGPSLTDDQVLFKFASAVGYEPASNWRMHSTWGRFFRYEDLIKATRILLAERAAVSPATADERAAFESDCLRRGYASRDLTRIKDGYYVTALTYMWDGWQAARASQAAAPADAREPSAWVTPEGDRSITQSQKQGMLRDGGAGASSVQPFSIACYAGAVPVDAGEVVAPVVAALRKLVHLKSLKDGADRCVPGYIEDRIEYQRDKPKAWDDARAALASFDSAQGAQGGNGGKGGEA